MLNKRATGILLAVSNLPSTLPDFLEIMVGQVYLLQQVVFSER
jgi:hypothetical protein